MEFQRFDSHGCPWISMDIHGYPHISMDIHSFIDIEGIDGHPDIPGFLWNPWKIHGNPLISVDCLTSCDEVVDGHPDRRRSDIHLYLTGTVDIVAIFRVCCFLTCFNCL